MKVTELILAAEVGWTWLYTAGMPPEASDRRRAEIASAAWEYVAWAREQKWAAGPSVLHAAWQFLAGTPHDLVWRLTRPSSRACRHRVDEAVVALLVLVGIVLGLPLSILAFLEGPDIARNDDVLEATAICAFAVPVMLLYGMGAILTLDRWPAASAALGLLGCTCLALSFAWWLPEIAASAVLAAAAALAAAFKADHEHSEHTISLTPPTN